MSVHKQVGWGTLGRELEHKLNNDNDAKIIIQGKNSQTGIGKTTLAIELCRWIDQHEWSAEDKAYIDVEKYLNDFLNKPKGSALLLDEIGAGADSRRATSTENVELSQGWQLLRSRNICTVATLPSTNMLDGRMLELADYWILVKSRGIAQPYRIQVNDFNGRIARKPMGPGDGEHIKFPDLPDSDQDKKYLDSIKDEKVESGGMESIKVAEHRKQMEEAREEAAQQRRNEIIKSLYRDTDMSYSDIGGLDTIDLTKQTIGQIVRGETGG